MTRSHGTLFNLLLPLAASGFCDLRLIVGAFIVPS